MKTFGLSSKEKIKKNTDFKSLYLRGKILIAGDKSLKATYHLKGEKDFPGIKVAAAVHKKAGNAVWRNRTKRLIRESYRLNKGLLLEKAVEREVCLKIVFSPFKINQKTKKNLNLSDIKPGILELMKIIYDSF